MLATVAPLKVTLAQRLQTNTEWGQVCRKLRRDAAGEIVFEGEQEPVRFEAPLGTPWPSGSEHLLDFVDDPDGAVAGLMPPEVFANLHPQLPQARAVGVRNLLATADALGSIPPVTVVAIPPTANGTAALFLEGRRGRDHRGLQQRLLHPGAAGHSGRGNLRALVEVVLVALQARHAGGAPPRPDAGQCGLPRRAAQTREGSARPGGAAVFRPLAARRGRLLPRPARALAAGGHRARGLHQHPHRCVLCRPGALAALPFFQAPAGAKNRDAGPLLTATLGWEDRKHKGTLKLPAALEQKFAGSGFMELSDQELAAASTPTPRSSRSWRTSSAGSSPTARARSPRATPTTPLPRRCPSSASSPSPPGSTCAAV